MNDGKVDKNDTSLSFQANAMLYCKDNQRTFCA